MRKTPCIQLLALLAIQFLHFTDGKAFEENEVLSLEKKEENAADEDYLDKRETDDQDNELESEEEEEMEKREPEEEQYEVEDMEKREPEEEDYEEEEMERREPEEEQYEEEEVEKREPEDEALEYDDEIVVEKREDDSEETAAEETEEKREDAHAEESAESENNEVEDLDARAVQARFTLVDYRGRRINGQRQGLLLFNGGTVCDDGFSMNSAHAVCRTMGFAHARRYRATEVVLSTADSRHQ